MPVCPFARQHGYLSIAHLKALCAYKGLKPSVPDDKKSESKLQILKLLLPEDTFKAEREAGGGGTEETQEGEKEDDSSTDSEAAR